VSPYDRPVQLTELTFVPNLPYRMFMTSFSCESTKMAMPATTTMMMPYSAVVAPLSERTKERSNERVAATRMIVLVSGPGVAQTEGLR